VGLASQTKLQAIKLKYETLWISVFAEFQSVKPPHKRNDHYWRLSGNDSASKFKRSKFLYKI